MINYSQKSLYNLLIVIASIVLLYFSKTIIVPLFIALLLTIAVFPFTRFLEKKLHFNYILSAITSLVFIVFVISIIMVVVSSELSSILSNSDVYLTKIGALFNQISMNIEQHFGINITQKINQESMNFGKLVKDNLSKILSFLSVSGGFISNIVLIPIYIFFFLIYRNFFKEFLYKLFHKVPKYKIDQISDALLTTQQNYLIGLITVMGIVGVLNSVGLLLLGIQNAIFFGFFAAMLLIIPYIGITIGSLLPAIIALATKDSAWYAVGVIAIFVFVQFLEGNFITPRITGSKVSINALVAIVGLLIFSTIWGISGMVLAMPIIASLKVLFDASNNLKPYGFLIGEVDDELIK